jgi:twitching motility protein PilT
MHKHVITIEDPIEYVFENGLSIVEQREVGNSTKSFENGLKYALRQASDVVMI